MNTVFAVRCWRCSCLWSRNREVHVCVQSSSMFVLEGSFTPYTLCILSHLAAAALCVFNTMTLFLREGLMRSGRYGSSTSPAGLTTACPITPQACWDLLGESSPRPWTTLGPWWFTAGQRAWAGRSYIYASFLCWQVFNDQWLCPEEFVCSQYGLSQAASGPYANYCIVIYILNFLRKFLT